MHSLSEIRNVLEFQNWSQVCHFIVKLRGWSEHFIGQGNPDDF